GPRLALRVVPLRPALTRRDYARTGHRLFPQDQRRSQPDLLARLRLEHLEAAEPERGRVQRDHLLVSRLQGEQEPGSPPPETVNEVAVDARAGDEPDCAEQGGLEPWRQHEGGQQLSGPEEGPFRI